MFSSYHLINNKHKKCIMQQTISPHSVTEARIVEQTGEEKNPQRLLKQTIKLRLNYVVCCIYLNLATHACLSHVGLHKYSPNTNKPVPKALCATFFANTSILVSGVESVINVQPWKSKYT